MIRPDRATFRTWAREHTVVPVWRELLADQVTPVSAFTRLCPDDEPGFLLLRASLGKTTALAGAGYDPLQLKPSLPVPDRR